MVGNLCWPAPHNTSSELIELAASDGSGMQHVEQNPDTLCRFPRLQSRLKTLGVSASGGSGMTFIIYRLIWIQGVRAEGDSY